ncbi:hypothetical protein [Pelotomaculum propionicicum]|uniref:Uncharacterized protein n=1 Tax=Pelotomaculum propionicicum TaxID=258475 RepID=A0A4Y7RTB0_9FIRM|nr:hypothetical protein [Pelotomaculum propionicicum]NLI11832.1 hypothetical protein [Peptococcaceae bacterium]TEB12238.1 hypothetical protein Pmgp_01129 [Pelotomaculum propionicicum]
MAEEIKGEVMPGEHVIRLLEQSSKYGLDQETMLIYINSVNLMSILSLLGRRYGVKSNFSLPVPVSLPALPALVQGPAPAAAAPGAAPAVGPALENMMGTLMKALGGQGAGNSTAGQGINMSSLLNLLSVLGQNVDLGSLINLMAGLLSSGSKAAAKPEAGSVMPPASPGSPLPAAPESTVQKTQVEDKAVKREPPKIMKWDQLEERKKA